MVGRGARGEERLTTAWRTSSLLSSAPALGAFLALPEAAPPLPPCLVAIEGSGIRRRGSIECMERELFVVGSADLESRDRTR